MLRGAILAAGEGSRLRAQGIETPKALVEIDGVPLIERVARAMVAAGVGELHVVLHPRASAAGGEAVLARAIGPRPLRLQVAETPSSFHTFERLLPDLAGRPFLASMVDSVFDPATLPAFVAAGRARPGAMAGLALTDFVEDDNPLRVALGPDDRVVAIGPQAAQSPLVTGGIYWFGAGIAGPAAAARATGVHRMRNFLAGLVEAGDLLFGFRFGKIVDCDTLEDLRAAQPTGRHRP